MMTEVWLKSCSCKPRKAGKHRRLEEERKDPALWVSEEHGLADALTLDLWPPEFETAHVCCSNHQVLWDVVMAALGG